MILNRGKRAGFPPAAPHGFFPGRVARGGFYGSDTGAVAGQRRFPDSATQWGIAYPTVTTPSRIWTWQEASGNVIEKIGTGADLAPNYSAAYQQAGETEPTLGPRFGIQTVNTNATERFECASTAPGSPGAGSMTLWMRCKMPDNTTTDRSLWGKVFANGSLRGYIEGSFNTGKVCFIVTTPEGSVTVKTSSDYGIDSYFDVWFVIDAAAQLIRIITSTEEATASITALTTPLATPSALRFFCSSGTTALSGTGISYSALWDATAITAAQAATLRTSLTPISATRDGPGNWYVPVTAGDFTTLGLAVPDYLWLCQEASGDLQNAIGTALPLTANATGHLYQQTVAGWTRKFLGTDGVTADQSWRTASALLDLANGQSAAMVALGSTSLPVVMSRDYMSLAATARLLITFSGINAPLRTFNGGVGASGVVNHAPITTVHQFCWYRNAATDTSGALSELESIPNTHNESASVGATKGLGHVASAMCPEARYGWFAIYLGANAERDWSAYLTVLRG